MDSQRLIINNYDLSTTSLTTTTTQTGFTVVKAPKGPITPVLISANSAQGATKQMKEIFGDWSKDYPELYEVAQFISAGYDCYVSAPYSEGTNIPIAYLTNRGVAEGLNRVPYTLDVENLVNGTDEPVIDGITNITDDSVDVLYNINYPKTYFNAGTDAPNAIPEYNNGLVFSAGTALTAIDSNAMIIRNAFGEDVRVTLSSSSVLDKNSISVGTADISNGKITITGSNDSSVITVDSVQKLQSNDARKDIVAFWEYSEAPTDIKAVIFPKYPSARNTVISFGDFTAPGKDSTKATTRNELVFAAYDTGFGAYGNVGTISNCTVHLDTAATDEEYKNQNIIAVHVRGTFKDADLRAISGYPSVTLAGGTRELGGDLHDLGWAAAQEDEYSDVDVFFESEIHNTAPDSTSPFFGLSAIHTLSGFVYNYTVSPSAIPATANNYGSSYWNICNLAKIEDSTKGSIWSPMTGSYSKMLCNIIKNRWGGVAPMYLNSAGMGGQLQGMENVKALKYNYKKDAQMKLDAKNFNPVIKDSTYGVMVVGQKTSKAGAVTDWSYIGHVSAFLNFEKEIKNNVMIPQLGKANNDYYRALRAQQVEAYLAKRLQGSTRIWAAASVDTSTADGCNDAAARKARKFVINVKVKVDIFSEYVELNFVNVDQDMTV